MPKETFRDMLLAWYMLIGFVGLIGLMLVGFMVFVIILFNSNIIHPIIPSFIFCFGAFTFPVVILWLCGKVIKPKEINYDTRQIMERFKNCM